jgi:hypothetical protein
MCSISSPYFLRFFTSQCRKLWDPSIELVVFSRPPPGFLLIVAGSDLDLFHDRPGGPFADPGGVTPGFYRIELLALSAAVVDFVPIPAVLDENIK